MNEVPTTRPMMVLDSTAGPYINLFVSQVGEIRRHLDSHGIQYEVHTHSLAFEGEPATTYIFFGRGADRQAIQAILDVGL